MVGSVLLFCLLYEVLNSVCRVPRIRGYPDTPTSLFSPGNKQTDPTSLDCLFWFLAECGWWSVIQNCKTISCKSNLRDWCNMMHPLSTILQKHSVQFICMDRKKIWKSMLSIDHKNTYSNIDFLSCSFQHIVSSVKITTPSACNLVLRLTEVDDDIRWVMENRHTSTSVLGDNSNNLVEALGSAM